jgi:hypothetical protein
MKTKIQGKKEEKDENSQKQSMKENQISLSKVENKKKEQILIQEIEEKYQQELDILNKVKLSMDPKEIDEQLQLEFLQIQSKKKPFEIDPDLESEEIPSIQQIDFIPLQNRDDYNQNKEETMLEEFNEVILESSKPKSRFKISKQLIGLTIKKTEEISLDDKEKLAQIYVQSSIPIMESKDKEEDALESEFNNVIHPQKPVKKRNQTYLTGEVKTKRRPFPFKKGEIK